MKNPAVSLPAPISPNSKVTKNKISGRLSKTEVFEQPCIKITFNSKQSDHLQIVLA
jgi:hypothetical protein